MLKEVASFIAYNFLRLDHGSRLAGALEFFIYDTIKIFLLLSVIIFIVSVIRSYFPPERTKKILSHKKEFIGNILPSVLAFMMAVTALALPEMIILRKVLKIPLLAVFAGIMTVTITAVGYLFNTIL